MEKNLGSMKIENYSYEESQTGFRCNGCKGTFQKPILATVSSHGSVQTYHACPRCLSKIRDVKYDKNEESKETPVSVKNVKKVVAAKHEESVKCKYFLGYLKKRSRDMPIPEECLICDKMIECLVH